MAQQLPFNGFYSGESRKLSRRTAINFMPVPGDQGDSSNYSLFSTTGITQGPRLQNRVDEVGYWKDQSGGTLNTICATLFAENSGVVSVPIAFTDGVTRSLTGVFKSLGKTETYRTLAISIESISNQFAIVASFEGIFTGDSLGTVVWTWDGSAFSTGSFIFESDVFEREKVAITDTAYMNGRFLYLNPVVEHDGGQISELSNRIYYSGVNDPESVDALAFISLNSQTGNLVGMESLNNRLYVFTETEMAVYAPANDQLVPFVEQTASSKEVGLLGPRAKTQFGSSIYMIGRVDGQARFIRISGGSPEVISTKEINSILNKAAFENTRVFDFQDQGRSMIAFSFDDYTLCLDIATGEYHRRSTNGGRWGVVSYTPGGVFVTNDGPPGELVDRQPYSGREDASVGTEFGEIMFRECITSNFNSNGMTNRLSELTIQTEVDYSTPNDDYSDPSLALSVSGDFGNTFGLELSENMGARGDFDKLLRFLNLGVYRQAFTVRLRTSNPYPHRLVKMLARLKKGIRQV